MPPLRVQLRSVGGRGGVGQHGRLLAEALGRPPDGDVDVVHLNPSLRHRALLRDQVRTVRARRAGARVVWQLHGIDPRLGALLARTGWPGGLGPDHWVVLHEGARALVRSWGVPARRVSRVGPCARSWDLPPRHPLGPWLFLGRLDRNKAVHRLLDVTDRPVVVVGDGPTRAGLERHARLRGVDATFVGWVDDPSPWLARCAGLVLPSDQEGLPLCVLEALGSGRPVVASAVGGLPFVLPGRCLVPPGDLGALRRALGRVEDVPPATQERIRATYAPETVAAQLMAVYEQVMETP